jgi:hypothetical protein
MCDFIGNRMFTFSQSKFENKYQWEIKFSVAFLTELQAELDKDGLGSKHG